MGEEGVVALLLVKGFIDGKFGGEDACGEDAKIERCLLGEKVVEIVGLVSAMKVTKAKVEDAWCELGAIVGRRMKRWGERGEGVSTETERGHWDW